jgi:hypothetical protein
MARGSRSRKSPPGARWGWIHDRRGSPCGRQVARRPHSACSSPRSRRRTSGRYKQAVVAELSRIAAAADEWRRIFEDHVATVMRVRRLPRPEAERAAYDIVVVEFLNATHPDTDPNRCAWCGRAETPGGVLLPFGVGPHAWMHSDCWESWRAQRRAKAEEDLARLGIVRSTER